MTEPAGRSGRTLVGPSPPRASERELARERTRLRRRGFTLLELLLVMFLLALLLGSGLGVFAVLDPGRRQVTGSVKSALRSARNAAAASRAPARVLFDADANTLTAMSLRVVGTWRFEGRRLEGGNQLAGRADPELFVADGYLGDAISFTDRRGAEATIPVHLDPAFDLRDGFAIECMVRHEGLGGGRLLSLASAVTLELNQGGQVRGRVQAAPAAPGTGAGRAGSFHVLSGFGAVHPGRWTRLRLSYDRRELVLEVEGVRVAVLAESAPVASVDGPLVLSDERYPFPGSVDDLVVSAVVAGEPVRLEGARLVAPPDAVHFEAGGGLDRGQHPEPVQLELAFEDGSRESLGIGFYGTVDG